MCHVKWHKNYIMRRKIVLKGVIAIIKTINFIPMLIYIQGNVLAIWQAAWLHAALIAEGVYYIYALRLVLLTHNKKHLQLSKRVYRCYIASCILSPISTVILLIAMVCTLPSAKYALIAVWGVLLIVWITSQLITDKKLLAAPLIEAEQIDFTKLTDVRVECTRSEMENVSICFGAVVIMSFVVLVPVLAVAFETLRTLLLFNVIAAAVCNLLLLSVFYFVGKKVKRFNKRLTITYLIYFAVQIMAGIASYLLYIGGHDILRGAVFFLYISSFGCLWVIQIAPMGKYVGAMRAYLQENE